MLDESLAPEAFLDPENLATIERLQAWLEEQPGVGGTTSVAGILQTVDGANQNGDLDVNGATTQLNVAGNIRLAAGAAGKG